MVQNSSLSEQLLKNSTSAVLCDLVRAKKMSSLLGVIQGSITESVFIKLLCFFFLIFPGRDETMQPARPSFLEYFEQKAKENQVNSFGKNVSGQTKNSSDWKVPQDGDYEFVSLYYEIQSM